MKRQSTRDGVEILHHMLDEDPELNELYKEELHKLQLADKIKRARKSAGISQNDLAKKINTTQSVISRLENSNYDRFSMSTLVKVAMALGCNLQVDLIPQKT